MASTAIAVAATAERAERPGLCAMVMLTGDIAAIALSLTAAVLLRYVFGGMADLTPYWRLSNVLIFFAAGYALFGLYPGIASNPVREMRQITAATTLVFVLLGSLLFLMKQAPNYSRLVFLFGWLIALVLVPLTRITLRAAFSEDSWWGYPVAVFGSAADAEMVVQGLQKQPELGLRPVAVFQKGGRHGDRVLDVPVFGDFSSAPLYGRRLGLKHAIVSAPEVAGAQLVQLMESHADLFSHVYLVSGLPGFSSLAIEMRDVCNMVALEVRRGLLMPGCQLAKRLIDQTVCIIIGLLLLPVMLLVAALIRLESKGGALFTQKRIGFGGRQFRMWKFRTMYSNSDEILRRHLAENPAAEREWQANRKLRNDPRVTRLGRLLRKTSLDELPQLWNVFRGQMSIVGPRPIVNDEIAKYGDWFALYCRVVPGLTGLWQVSGRSDTDYGKRIELDSYYVRNWSPWFDIYLLACTVRVVVKGEGAY